MSKDTAVPFGWEIAMGQVSGHTPLHILGHNQDTSTALEDIWEGGGGSGTNLQIPHPAVGGIQMELVSSSADDDGAPVGTGARTVDIHYLDANYVAQEETVIMNGVTPVDTVATDILRVQLMHVKTVGTGLKAAGTITLESTDSAIEYCRIRAGLNNSLKAEWTVPAGKTLFIDEWSASAISTTASRDAEVLLQVTSEVDSLLLTDIFLVKDIILLTDDSFAEPFKIPLIIPAQADIKISITTTAEMEASASFEGWYA